MPNVSGEYESIEVSSIKVPADRQRKDIPAEHIERIADSIKRHGQLQPIGVSRDLVLSWGHCRLLAKQLLKHDFIDVQFTDTLSLDDMKAMEFEENYQRKDLTWQEKALAVHDFHATKLKADPNWSQRQTGICMGVEQSFVSKLLTVGLALVEQDEQVMGADTLGAAFNLLERRRARAADSELEMVNFDEVMDEPEVSMDLSEEDLEPLRNEQGEIDVRALREPSSRPAYLDVLEGDFRHWVQSYEGPRFNFIHCDFPYGVGHQKSAQGAAALHGAYEDDPQVFWDLFDHFLQYRDRFIAESAHIMFWYSLRYHSLIVKAFEDHDFNVCPWPLIWVKSDNVGVLSRPDHWPRHTYESALLITRGGRKIVKATSDVISWPADKAKALHLSEKPRPVLSHFFRMFVDSSTIMLDPTCGSGGAVAAAQGLWALRVLGIDNDPEHVETAQGLLRAQREAMSGEAEDEEDDGLEEVIDV